MNAICVHEDLKRKFCWGGDLINTAIRGGKTYFENYRPRALFNLQT